MCSDLAAPGARGPLVYERAAEDIAAWIVSGELPLGTRLRAERELAAYYGVAYGIIRRAMEVLRKRELIITIADRRTFVAWERRGAPAGYGRLRRSRTWRSARSCQAQEGLEHDAERRISHARTILSVTIRDRDGRHQAFRDAATAQMLHARSPSTWTRRKPRSSRSSTTT